MIYTGDAATTTSCARSNFGTERLRGGFWKCHHLIKDRASSFGCMRRPVILDSIGLMPWLRNDIYGRAYGSRCLPPSRHNFDHKIEILPNAQVPAGRVHKMSTLELQELKRQLQDYLSKKNGYDSHNLCMQLPSSSPEKRMDN